MNEKVHVCILHVAGTCNCTIIAIVLLHVHVMCLEDSPNFYPNPKI